MWILALRAARVQPSLKLQPPTYIFIYNAACAAVWITKKLTNPLLRIGLHQLVVHCTDSPESAEK